MSSQDKPVNHRPRKRFGQHFLHDPGVLDRMLRSVDPRPGETVVEIGPGLGALTLPLLERLGQLQAVELDRDLIPRLAQAAEGQGVLTIHEADALRFDYAGLAPDGERLRIVGNLPYNISTPLIFHLLEQSAVIADMHFLLQKEVVDRLTAAPGGPDYGRLSVMVQYRCRTQSLFVVRPGAFNPPPKVDSAFVRLIPHRELPHPAADEPLLARVVAAAFAQRRKTLRNALDGLVDAQAFDAAGIDPGRRAQTLSVAEFVALSAATGEDTAQGR
jgi:16S rRNA (adenine1518-N6/adenine1519-N6)-dimethyltransferase